MFCICYSQTNVTTPAPVTTVEVVASQVAVDKEGVNVVQPSSVADQNVSLMEQAAALPCDEEEYRRDPSVGHPTHSAVLLSSTVMSSGVTTSTRSSSSEAMAGMPVRECVLPMALFKPDDDEDEMRRVVVNSSDVLSAGVAVVAEELMDDGVGGTDETPEALIVSTTSDADGTASMDGMQDNSADASLLSGEILTVVLPQDQEPSHGLAHDAGSLSYSNREHEHDEYTSLDLMELQEANINIDDVNGYI